MKFANAFNCKEKCPESSNEDGCPCWTELIETNITTGEERITKACLFQLFPKLVIELIKASNRPAESVDQIRSEIAGGFGAICSLMKFSQRFNIPDGTYADAEVIQINGPNN